MNGWNKNRLAQSFETRKSAKRRRDELESEQSTQLRKKDHTGVFDKMAWNKADLKAEVNGYENGKHVIWSELANRYHVTSKNGDLADNGGQIVKAWLISEGVDLSRFVTKERVQPIIRRRKRKIHGGEITVPTGTTKSSTATTSRETKHWREHYWENDRTKKGINTFDRTNILIIKFT